MNRSGWSCGALVAGLLLAACGGLGGSDEASSDSIDGDDGDAGDCTVVDMAVSSEKITLLTELANDFNGSDDADTDTGCVFVRPARKSSGAAAQLIVDGWPDPEINGDPPVIWSPAASGWGAPSPRPAPRSCSRRW